MYSHEKYRFKKLEELVEKIDEMKLDVPISEELDILKTSCQLSKRELQNRMIVHPMEGCDGELDGSPGELTFRRYQRFARGGAGLLWFEATAVVPEGRANPRHLYINKENVAVFKRLLDVSLEEGKKVNGDKYKPYTVLQLTHSGRYSRPVNAPAPIIAVNNPYLDKKDIQQYHIITDEELMALEDAFVEAAELAKKAGFDAVDIKCCHRYLCSELLSAHTREGQYGGSFENRTRFLLNIIDKIRNRMGDSIDITVRLNIFDAIPYPYGWGVDKNSPDQYDLEEPIQLVKALSKRGVEILNVSAGNPYYNPHIGRAYDLGSYVPKEHPLEGIHRLMELAKLIQQQVHEMMIIGTGFSWLRNLGPHVAAGGIKNGYFKLVGFGRQAFAYPDFPRDILEKGEFDKKKCCIACSKCTEIMRDGGRTGCVIYDQEVYKEIYLAGRDGKPSLVGTHEADHI
ncbi:NADH:flavin oxidoreductase [Clostridium formicaceticum]|uniref:Flavin oxidoreductase/NADH oxidase n=1 Tax=Clostridium formicaceticum TaxID=1497 RepID=A0AAC9RND9_9CLOT|nr:NADH:flavin oxidoreductase [Clostridium formicaceticum]AOY74528.1 flavin oxidoreductase/NADH oxidase [Clostridium formicaceticum]ARE88884.1 NADPH dehydrogenase [Clostridium formicaceticum]